MFELNYELHPNTGARNFFHGCVMCSFSQKEKPMNTQRRMGGREGEEAGRQRREKEGLCVGDRAGLYDGERSGEEGRDGEGRREERGLERVRGGCTDMWSQEVGVMSVV